jgi:hypothetical protein
MTRAIKPKGTPPRGVCFCRECGHPFYPRREDQEYCAYTCRTRYHKRRYERGAQLYDFAMEWRGKRLKGGFTQLCQIVDEWLRDQRDRRKAHKEIKTEFERQQKAEKGVA